MTVSVTAPEVIDAGPPDVAAPGLWCARGGISAWEPEALRRVAADVRQPTHVVVDPAMRVGIAIGGTVGAEGVPRTPDSYRLLGSLPALYPEWLGDRSFCAARGVRFPYVAGEMANGIATIELVTAMAKAEMLGFFGAAGLDPATVDTAIDRLSRELAGRVNWGVNLIHSPEDPAVEEAVADLLIRRRVPQISVSAFAGVTPSVARCAAAGLRVDAAGRIERRARIMAKVSRPEVAEQFMSPAPPSVLQLLVSRGLLTQDEARLASVVPVAEDITVEADSGGHTDNRPLVSVLPAIHGLREVVTRRHGPGYSVRIGAAGGLGTPGGIAAAFGLGAAYVLTGTVNESCVESGLSDEAKAMLAQADVSDVAMAPAADMFEMGVRLQVLRRGTMFASRATQLYEAYRDYPSLEDIPPRLRSRIENSVFGATFDEIWVETQKFWRQRDPARLIRAESDPKERMALVFRWYLGNSSRWAITGEHERRTDYQIWCGPAIGSFNRWVGTSFLAEPANRSVVQVARNLLEGAAVVTRAHQLRCYGVPMPSGAFDFRPRRIE